MARALINLVVVMTAVAPSPVRAEVNTGALSIKLGKDFLKRTIAAEMRKNVDGQKFEEGEGRSKVKGKLKCQTAGCSPHAFSRRTDGIAAAYVIDVKLDNLPDLTASFSVRFGMTCDPRRNQMSGGASVSGFRLHLPAHLGLPFLAGIVEMPPDEAGRQYRWLGNAGPDCT